MEERTTGIILRTRLLTETSLIVQWLTADAGRVATVAKGARRPKSAFRGKLDLFHEADLVFRRSSRSELHTLQEVALRETHPELRADWDRLSRAAYGVALVEWTTETDTPLPEAWDLFRGYLGEVCSGPKTMRAVLALELRHLADLGQLPELNRPSLLPDAGSLAAALLECSWPEIRGLPPDPAADAALSRFLHGFLIHHLGRLPRGRAEALGAGERGFVGAGTG
jgi:hypothetical protein